MIRKVRTKVASKISKIEEVEDFNYSSWLKRPLIQDQPVEELDSHLDDTSKILIAFDKSENFQRKFDFSEPEVKDAFQHYTFPKVRSNAIFFMIALPLEKFVYYPDSDAKNFRLTQRGFEFLLTRPPFRRVNVRFDNIVYQSYECVVPVPESFNYLEEVLPEVINIELLSLNKLLGDTGEADVHSFKFEPFSKTKVVKKALPQIPKLEKIYKIKVPSVGKFSSTNKEITLPEFLKTNISKAFPVKFSKVKNFYANFQLAQKNAFLMYTSSKEKTSKDAKDKKSSAKGYSNIQEQLKFILSNVRKVDWEKSKSVQIRLKPYEESAAKFLAENDIALLQDELGFDTEKEVIAALKILFMNRIVKSILILTTENKKGNLQLSGKPYTQSGWIDKVIDYCPELSVTLVEGSDKERTELWNTNTSVVLATIENATNDYYFKTLSQKRLDKFDCVIIDGAHLVFSTAEKGKKFAETIKPKILWAVSSHLDRNLQQNLNEWFGSSVEIEKVLIRSKESLREQTPKFIWNEMWVSADEAQAKEFKLQLADCKKELKRVLESENPLRFIVNIYTLLHRLNQLSNFAPNSPSSPKTELLLEQLLTIQSNGKKALVLSQYDRQGTKKLNELLIENRINAVTIHGGTSVEDINKAVSLFKSRDDMVAFVADSKTTKVKYKDLGISYIIKFDHWWNPINNWELEDIFSNEENSISESINIFHYYTLGGIDEKVREFLINGDLLNRNIYELMQPKVFEEIILVDEWLKVFDMPVNTEDTNEPKPETILKQLNFLSVNDFRKLLIKFFSTMGYSNLDVLESHAADSFTILGKARRNNRDFSLNASVFTKSKTDQKTFEEILSEASASITDKIFIITKGEIPQIENNLLRDNITLLDGLTLSKLLLRFGLIKVEA
jgi:hypothetical protein